MKSKNEKILNEIDALLVNMQKVQVENTVECTKTIKRGFAYRKTTVIKANDLYI